jgi:hypothetical protein
VVLIDQVQGLPEVIGILLQSLDRTPPETTLSLVGSGVRDQYGQCYLPFPEIIADRLS